MNLLDYLEHDKEKILHELAAAERADKAEAVLLPELDRILYQYNEDCSDPLARLEAAQMMKTAGMVLPLIDAAGETTVWEKTGTTEKPARMTKGAAALLILGAALLGGGFFLLLGSPGIPGTIPRAILSAVLLLLGGGCCFLAGRSAGHRGRKKDPEKDYLTQTALDTGKVYRTLRAALMLMDQTIAGNRGKQLADSGASVPGKAVKGEDERAQWQELERSGLLYDLLEASYRQNGAMALEKLEALKYELHLQGITLLEYGEETKDYFDLMPGKRAQTLRPAVFRDGTLLRRGLAAGGM